MPFVPTHPAALKIEMLKMTTVICFHKCSSLKNSPDAKSNEADRINVRYEA